MTDQPKNNKLSEDDFGFPNPELYKRYTKIWDYENGIRYYENNIQNDQESIPKLGSEPSN
jgi:hypothetical protein